MSKDRLIPRRRKILLKEGFLPSEATYLSKSKLSSNKEIRKYRRQEVRNAKKTGITKTAYKQSLRDTYRAKGFEYKKSKRLNSQKVEAYLRIEIDKPTGQREYLDLLAVKNRLELEKHLMTFRLTHKVAQEMTKPTYIDENNVIRFQNVHLLDHALKTQNMNEEQRAIALLPYKLTEEQMYFINTWLQFIKQHKKSVSDDTQENIKRGMSPREALLKAVRDINARYLQKDKSPWDFVKQLYKVQYPSISDHKDSIYKPKRRRKNDYATKRYK